MDSAGKQKVVADQVGFGDPSSNSFTSLRREFELDGSTCLLLHDINDSAYTLLQQGNAFVFGYVREVTDEAVKAVPYVIGHLVAHDGIFAPRLGQSLQLRLENIDQFSNLDHAWSPSQTQFRRIKDVPEREVKALICRLLNEPDIPKDWGGEECDVFTANVLVGGHRQSCAFLLKGPAKFHEMTIADCGKNGDQVARLFQIPADVYIVQHCHRIGSAVRKMTAAFALQRWLVAPCQYAFIDGYETARLLRANGVWDSAPTSAPKAQ